MLQDQTLSHITSQDASSSFLDLANISLDNEALHLIRSFFVQQMAARMNTAQGFFSLIKHRGG